MKRIISIILTFSLLFSSLFLMTSCDVLDSLLGEDITGVYEMVSIEGSATYNGVSVELEEGLYDYYVIELEKGGKGEIRSAAYGTSTEMRADIEWEYDKESGELKIISEVDGVELVETMHLEKDTIEYETTQSGYFGGVYMTIEMSITLEKKD